LVGNINLAATVYSFGVVLDMQMCEVEVPGDMCEVIGDEEGLMMCTGVPAGDAFYPRPSVAPGGNKPYGSNHSWTDDRVCSRARVKTTVFIHF
jgi:hypothetical protein